MDLLQQTVELGAELGIAESGSFEGEILEILKHDDFSHLPANFLSDITLGIELQGLRAAAGSEPLKAAAGGKHQRPVDKSAEDRHIKRAKTDSSEGQQALLGEREVPYDAKIKDRRQVAEGTWHAAIGTVELLTMRGNFWRVMGHSANRKNYLHAEFDGK